MKWTPKTGPPEGWYFSEASGPRELADDEDQNLSLAGRWVDSHELLAGDTIIGKDGKLLVVRGISQRFEAEFPVTNLTIADLHNYTVGTASILVHNTPICEGGRAALRDMLNTGEATFDELSLLVRGADNAEEVLRDLAASALELHHLFPQAKRFQPFFQRAGIQIEDYKIPLDKAKHRLKPNGIHTKEGGDWNKVWDDFFKESPMASKSDIFAQLGRMRFQFGI